MSLTAYYKWLQRESPANEVENEHIAEEIEKIHKESSDKGYRRIRNDQYRYHSIQPHDKRMLRICRKKESNLPSNMQTLKRERYYGYHFTDR